MMKRLLSILLSLAMILGAFAALTACNDTEQDTESPTAEQSETSAPTEAPTDNETETGPETETDPPDLYGNGDTVKDAGVQWNSDLFALKDNVIDESKAVEKSAAELYELLKNKTALKEGEVYIVKEPLVLESNTRYYGNLASVIAEGGIVIKDVSEVVVKELIIKGNVTVENSTGITFFKVDVKGGSTGVSIDEKSEDVAFKNCRVSATDTAISSAADLLLIYRGYLCASNGIVSTGDELGMQDSMVIATKTGISSNGKYCTVKGNTIEVASDGIGIDYKADSYNGLIALNIIKDAQTSVKVANGFNCVVLLNSAINIIGENNVNLYVVENKLGGRIELNNNKYLLCDGNTSVNDGKDHAPVSLNNTEYNGDNLHDVNSREQYGAKEELLPHTNKDLFLGMERHSKVRDVSLTKSYTYNNYVRTMARQNTRVIVPPGAYITSDMLSLDATHSNTTIYAYGVYQEKDILYQALEIKSGNNITVKGLSIGYTHQSAGQVYVLEKLDNQKLRVVTNAGYINDFGKSNLDVFNSSHCDIFFEDALEPWNNGIGHNFIEKCDDGTMILQYTGSAKEFSTIGVGDILSSRLAGDNSRSIYLNGQNIKLKDCVLYGYSAALAIVSNGRGNSNIELERLHNTAHSGYLIDKETYDRYKELEAAYGADLEVYIDELGRYRGGLPRVGSVDATHINGGSVGVNATSCLFESMCDDGSNQRGTSSRLAGYHDNGDGTTTLYIKSTLSQTYYNIHVSKRQSTASPSTTDTPMKGDRIFVYASNGHIAFEGNVLGDAVPMGSIPVCTTEHTEEGHCCLHMVHYDNNNDCICDDEYCKALMHYDLSTKGTGMRDGLCDKCGTKVYSAYNSGDGYAGIGNGTCYVWKVTLADEDGDGLNDADGVPILTDMAQNAAYNESGSQLSFQIFYNPSIITYKCTIYKVTVKTDLVNFEAFEGYDVTDNDYFMNQKILVDNISMNSAGFVFDNVMIRNTRCRGILVKTVDATIKNCTFRNLGLTGVLLSVETVWGESTVPKNTVIQNCLFDNTGCCWGTSNNFKIAPIAIEGLGDLSGMVTVSEDTLPCRNITIVGNKFMNISNNYCITLSAAQGITIKDNVFVARDDDNINKKYGRAIYISGCANINISGNTYSAVLEGDITKAIIASNYRGLTGSDVEGIFEKDMIAAQD